MQCSYLLSLLHLGLLLVYVVQPKFLTKAEREALALQRRQQEAAGVRALQDEMRRLQAAQQQVTQRCTALVALRWPFTEIQG